MSIASFAAHVSHASHASHASSHEDEDFKESDGWRLQSDASTASSRVTTPDLPPGSHRHLPLSSSGSRTPFASRPPTVAPLRSVYNFPEHVSLSESKKAVPAALTSHDSMPLDQSIFPSFVPGYSARSIDVSQWRQQPRLEMHESSSPEILPHRASSYPSLIYMRNLARDKMASTERSRSWAPSPSVIAIAGVDHAGMVAPQAKPAAGSSTEIDKTPPLYPSRTTHHQSDSSDDESESTFSSRRPVEEPSWSSESSSGEDPVFYQNSRQFPPRLPAAPVHQPTLRRSRAVATNRIASWVSNYERSNSPRQQNSKSLVVRTLRQASESTVDESIFSATTSAGEVEMLWQQLKQKRARLAELRHDMATKRTKLRDLRQRKNDADNTFMNIIRPMLVSRTGLPHASVHGLLDRIAAMQSLRDDYHFRESEYEKLEMMLDEEETELNDIEVRFFSLLAAGQADEANGDDSDAETSSSTSYSDAPYELIGISQDGPPEDLHPLYRELAMALGDLANAKEEYDDLLFVKKQIDYNHELKHSTGLKGMREVREFLQEFPSEEERMKQSIVTLKANVERLKDLCLRKNVMRKHLSVRMEYALNPDMKYEDIDLDDKSLILAKPRTLAHAQFPELLSQPDHLISEPEVLTAQAAVQKAAALPNNHPHKKVMQSVAMKQFSIDRLMQGRADSGKANFVNRWLLQQLRLSPLNAWLLHSTFVISQSLKIQDHWRWQYDVLHYWWRDGTMTCTFSATVSNDSEYSFRLGTPGQSRAASDGGAIKSSPPLHRRVSSGDAATIHG